MEPVSILMSIYKNENPVYFEQALVSILEQTRKPSEILIMIDGPITKEIDAVLQKYRSQHSQIKTYQFEQQVMLGKALRKGVELCENELIARMDTDDIARPDRLQKQYEYMIRHKEVDILGGCIEEFDEDGNQFIKRMPTGCKNIKEYAKYRNPINHMTVMFRRQAVLNAGNYRHFPFLEDYDLWLRLIAKDAVIENLSDILVDMRRSKAVFKRRRGISYLFCFLKLRRQQKELGLLSNAEYIRTTLCTICFCLQPAALQKRTYSRLRKISNSLG